MPKTQTQTQDETQFNRRAGFKWTVNECLKLEREYDLLKMSLDDIALLHERSVDAIMYKLDKEGIADYTQLYIETYGDDCDDDSDNDDACSENSDEEYEEDCQEENSDDEEEVDEEEEEVDEYDSYNLKQQVDILTKQLANLTAIVYKSLSWGKSEKKLSVNC
jgi:hypothetical protein